MTLLSCLRELLRLLSAGSHPLCTAPKASHPTLLKNRLFKQVCSRPWTLNIFGRNLNMEGKLERTEAALRGPWLHSVCVVLMSTFVQTVAFQIHANRRSVFCVALYRWPPVWTQWQHVVAKHSDAVLSLTPSWPHSPHTWPSSQCSCWQTLCY